MKNKILKFVFTFIIVFLFKMNYVHGEFSCVYGEKANWSPIIRFEVKSYEDSGLQHGTSFINENCRKDKNGETYNLEQVSGKEYQYICEDMSTTFKKRFYVNLYSSVQEYNNLLKASENDSTKNPCPEVLYLYYDDSGIDEIFMYHDTLEKAQMEKKSGEEISHYKSVILVEERSKDKSISEIIDKNGCFTYSTYITALESVRNANNGSCDNSLDFDNLYSELRDMCDAFRSTSSYASSEYGESVAKSCSKACSLLKDDIHDMCSSGNSNGGSCGSLGYKIIKWIFKIINFARYIVPALLIIMSILDFIKAISDEEKMKEATSKFFKRLIAAALVFIVPFILDFILKMFDIPGLSSSNPFCAK